MTYQRFRTGLDFATVQQMLWVASEDSEKWIYKGRHTVLGLWMQMKIDMWRAHQRECCPQALQTPEEIDAEIPF